MADIDRKAAALHSGEMRPEASLAMAFGLGQGLGLLLCIQCRQIALSAGKRLEFLVDGRFLPHHGRFGVEL
jgi:hypothetical protein